MREGWARRGTQDTYGPAATQVRASSNDCAVRPRPPAFTQASFLVGIYELFITSLFPWLACTNSWTKPAGFITPACPDKETTWAVSQPKALLHPLRSSKLRRAPRCVSDRRCVSSYAAPHAASQTDAASQATPRPTLRLKPTLCLKLRRALRCVSRAASPTLRLSRCVSHAASPTLRLKLRRAPRCVSDRRCVSSYAAPHAASQTDAASQATPRPTLRLKPTLRLSRCVSHAASLRPGPHRLRAKRCVAGNR
uniref:Uncharacterized protein n=1 Tax=Knipowitschia caucasica TaxID=637954 RepID=A0AAV2J8Q5_KNICA